ncbi:unnamed protein product [Clonostachys rosea f. rosea IK726]|uniref:Uncharacterized protein n=1 Tax=Clonostachys rosea f. rosea IK726 TaxID=1349383 RepID=A0ACA9TX40_BIOOC|nr:unnamed protein product [Clonostachys rosea f. rosea IK726]
MSLGPDEEVWEEMEKEKMLQERGGGSLEQTYVNQSNTGLVKVSTTDFIQELGPDLVNGDGGRHIVEDAKVRKFELKAWDNHKPKLKMKEQCADDEKIPY